MLAPWTLLSGSGWLTNVDSHSPVLFLPQYCNVITPSWITQAQWIRRGMIQHSDVVLCIWVLSIWRTNTFKCRVNGDKYTQPFISLQWRHNEDDDVSNHRRLECLLNRLFRCRYKNTKAPRHWPLSGDFPAQRASNAEYIWWRYHDKFMLHQYKDNNAEN